MEVGRWLDNPIIVALTFLSAVWLCALITVWFLADKNVSASTMAFQSALETPDKFGRREAQVRQGQKS